MSRRLFNLASALSLPLLAGTLLISDLGGGQPRSFEFQRGAARWEIASGGGYLWLANAPQVRLETQKTDAAVQRLRKDFEWERAGLHSTIDEAPYGSERYRQALESLHRVEADFEARRAAVPAPATTPVVHSLRLSIIAWIFAILPCAWLIRLPLAHPLVRRELRSPLNVVSIVLLLLSLVSATQWLRSYGHGATWSFGLQPVTGPAIPAYRVPIVWYSGRWLICSKGCIQLFDNQTVYPANYPVRESRGYRWGGFLIAPNNRIGSAVVPGEWHWWVPGIAYASRPTWFGPRGMTIFGYHSTTVSLWLPTLACLILPVIRIRSRSIQLRRERRRANNQCLACGYSITGNLSGVCPECGMAI